MTAPTAEQMKAGISGVFDRAAPAYDQAGVDFFGRIGEELEAAGTLEDVRRDVDAVLAQRYRDGSLAWWTDVHCTIARP